MDESYYNELKKMKKEDLIFEASSKNKESQRLLSELESIKEREKRRKEDNRRWGNILLGAFMISILLCGIFGLEYLFQRFSIVTVVLGGLLLICGFAGLFLIMENER